jgi:sucrose phosphorylase
MASLSLEDELREKIFHHLNQIYVNNDNRALSEKIIAVFFQGRNLISPNPNVSKWNSSDVILISYAHSIIENERAPLQTLHDFLNNYIKPCINAVHILPYFPYSSDDGFAIIDFKRINDAFGSWEDIEAIAKNYKLMSDLVINHVSSRSQWFDQFKSGKDPGQHYFLSVDPLTDTREVVRPRTSNVLQEVNTLNGKKYVWSTFSHDQPDLNFSNPAVLIEIVDIIRTYLERGTKIFRLDAVAFIWKKIGTECINLPQTHEIIRLIRTLTDFYSDEVFLITETNIPNRENLSYFGNRNEAHLVYNFALPPLILYTLLNGESGKIKQWLMGMPPAMFGTTYFNFIASHDGIGLRPVEEILTESEIDTLAQNVEDAGGKVSYRTKDNSQRPYELNIALFDALKNHVHGGDDSYQEARFLSAHTIMLSLEGIPAFYIHSLLATQNDYEKVKHSGQNRGINRHQWKMHELELMLLAENHHSRMFYELLRLITIRKKQEAFHPNATQFTLDLGNSILALWRQSLDRSQSIFSIHNIANQNISVQLSDLNLIETDNWVDLISETKLARSHGELILSPYQSMWISNKSSIM